jgi:hypothetical protein
MSFTKTTCFNGEGKGGWRYLAFTSTVFNKLFEIKNVVTHLATHFTGLEIVVVRKGDYYPASSLWVLKSIPPKGLTEEQADEYVRMVVKGGEREREREREMWNSEGNGKVGWR